MAKRVWAVSRGEYSDYGVTCICPDEETAKAVAARLNGPTPPRYDAHEVEERNYTFKAGNIVSGSGVNGGGNLVARTGNVPPLDVPGPDGP